VAPSTRAAVSVEETAEALKVRDWRLAKTWLYREIGKIQTLKGSSFIFLILAS
jgi:hypothetical protein